MIQFSELKVGDEVEVKTYTDGDHPIGYKKVKVKLLLPESQRFVAHQEYMADVINKNARAIGQVKVCQDFEFQLIDGAWQIMCRYVGNQPNKENTDTGI